MKEFHVWFFTPMVRSLLRNYYPSYSDILKCLKCGFETINTLNVAFCDMKIITKYGYRLFIHPQVGEPFEITLGKCANTSREIKPETNILNLLLSGEFNTDDCKVVEEVF